MARKEVQRTFFGVCRQSALGFFVDIVVINKTTERRFAADFFRGRLFFQVSKVKGNYIAYSLVRLCCYVSKVVVKILKYKAVNNFFLINISIIDI